MKPASFAVLVSCRRRNDSVRIAGDALKEAGQAGSLD